jgi:DNA-binding SARP family transcriptional activator/Tfp pilus assembly protein PilF
MIGAPALPAGGIELRTMGVFELTGPPAAPIHAIVSQPKRAALLVYLVLAQPRGLHRRDSLIALFWPESDQAHARHALSQLLHQLRRTLGPDALRSQGDEAVGIDPGQLWCDVLALEEALAADRLEEALELYRGDFLAGFFVPDAAPELDEWIAAERARLRAAAAAAAWQLVERDERAGHSAGAAHWARRAAALAPDDERVVRKLIDLLSKQGDRTGALRAYDSFAARLKREYDVEPTPALRAAADAVRRSPEPAPLSPPAELTSAGLTPPATGEPHAPVGAARGAHRLLWSAAAGVVFVAAGALLIRSQTAGGALPTIAVGGISDFTHGDPSASVPVVADLLATSLARLPSVQVIATGRLLEVQAQLEARRSSATLYDAARLAGAKQLIQGSLHATPAGGLRLDLERIDVESGRVRRGYRAEGPDLFATVDQVTTAMAEDFGVPAPDKPVADVTTRSLVAFRFYDEGLRAYYQNDLTGADRLFRAASEEDSSFAMAAYWVWLTSVGRGADEIQALERAARLADRTADRERLLIRAALAEARLELAAAAFAESLAFRYPADPDAQFLLGRMQHLGGDFRGAIQPWGRVLVLDSLSLKGQRTRCRACDAYVALVNNYIWADSFPAAERTVREWLRRQPSSPAPWGHLAGVFELQGQEDASLAALRIADSLTPGGIGGHVQDALRARLAVRRGNYREADQRLRRLVAERTWDDAEWFLAISLRNQGRLREAMALAISRETVLRPILLLELGRAHEAAADFEARGRGPLATSPVVRGHVARNLVVNLTHVATCLAAAGDTARLAGLADTVEVIGLNSLASGRDARLSHYIRGLLYAARRQPERAADEYRRAIFSWNEGYTRINYALAQALLQLGRATEAVEVLQPAFRGSLEAANLYMSRTDLHELLAHAFDAAEERDSAIVHWRAVASAWSGADPQFRARWEAARRRLEYP